MKKLEHLTDRYLEMSVEAHEVFQVSKPLHIDSGLLLPVHTGLESMIMDSVESLSHTSLKLDNVAREVTAYASGTKQSALRYLDVIEKQKRLISDSISPLIKANKVFIEIYGAAKFKELKNTLVQYFDRVHSHPIPIMNGVADAIKRRNPDDIRVTCKELLNCGISDGQLEYPTLSRLTATSKESLATLGYTAESFDHELQSLTGENSKGNASYLSLLQKKQDIVKQLNTLSDRIADKVKYVRPAKAKSDMREIMSDVSDLQSYNVALSSVMFLLQTASFSAYEAGYQLHLAELAYNNY